MINKLKPFFSIALLFPVLPSIASVEQSCTTLECVRQQINQVDSKLLQLLAARFNLVEQAGAIKKQHGYASAFDSKRELQIIKGIDSENLAKYNLPSEYVDNIFKCIINASSRHEETDVFLKKDT